MVRKLLTVMVGLALLGGFAVAEAGTLVLRVDTDLLRTFDQTHNGVFMGGAAFYVSGDICEENDPEDLTGPCTPIGTFHSWGWLVGPDQLVGLVSQEFNLNGRGKIQVQGVEDEGPRAVVGGTGKFRNVRGEATGFDLSKFIEPDFEGEFIATFKLIGAKSK